jgi:hypothetical protein
VDRTPIAAVIIVVLGSALVACAGAPTQVGEENNFSQQSDDKPKPDPDTDGTKWTGPSQDTGTATTTESGGLNEEQKKQMEIALKRGGDKAAQCPQSTGNEDVPRGKGEVKVVFDGLKGRVTEVTVGPPWAGTPIESCIKRSFVGEIVLPFEGDPLEVPYTVEIPAKKDAGGTKKK